MRFDRNVTGLIYKQMDTFVYLGECVSDMLICRWRLRDERNRPGCGIENASITSTIDQARTSKSSSGC